MNKNSNIPVFIAVLIAIIFMLVMAKWIIDEDNKVVSQYDVQAEHIKMSNQYNYCPYYGESLREDN